jgi:hypothetical protein
MCAWALAMLLWAVNLTPALFFNKQVRPPPRKSGQVHCPGFKHEMVLALYDTTLLALDEDTNPS